MDASFPEPHARGYTTQGIDDGVPVEATDWNSSWAWSAGAMISGVDDLLVWAEALATGEGLLSSESRALRINSFDFEVPVYLPDGSEVAQSPSRAYGLGLGLANGWYGHTGELPGYNTEVQHHLDSDISLVVMVNSDIASGDCNAGEPVMPGARTTGPCDNPAVHLSAALADAIGHPLVKSE